MDLVIQRAGRLRRHRRDAHGRPLPSDARDASADQRPGEPTLYLLAPPSEDEPDPRPHADALGGAAEVYRDHGRLWLTARFFREHPRVDWIAQARELIEWTYGPGSFERIPESLQPTSHHADRRAALERSAALPVLLEPNLGYTQPFDEDRPTHLGDELRDVLLVRQVRKSGSGKLVPEPWTTKSSSKTVNIDASIVAIPRSLARGLETSSSIKGCLEGARHLEPTTRILVFQPASDDDPNAPAWRSMEPTPGWTYDPRSGLISPQTERKQ